MTAANQLISFNIQAVWNHTTDRSEGFPRTGYFVLGRDGTGAWQISGVVRVTAGADFVDFVFFEICVLFLRFSEVFRVWALLY